MPDAPPRIQRRRDRGWRMPAGAVYVGRPSPWGNPWRAELVDGVGWCCTEAATRTIVSQAGTPAQAHSQAVERYRAWLPTQPTLSADAIRAALRGKALCCWCPAHLPCHADLLLTIANAPLTCEAADG